MGVTESEEEVPMDLSQSVAPLSCHAWIRSVAVRRPLAHDRYFRPCIAQFCELQFKAGTDCSGLGCETSTDRVAVHLVE